MAYVRGVAESIADGVDGDDAADGLDDVADVAVLVQMTLWDVAIHIHPHRLRHLAAVE